MGHWAQRVGEIGYNSHIYVITTSSFSQSMKKSMEDKFFHLLQLVISLLAMQVLSSPPSNTKKFHFNVSYLLHAITLYPPSHTHVLYVRETGCFVLLFLWLWNKISAWMEDYNKTLSFEGGINCEREVSWANDHREWRW